MNFSSRHSGNASGNAQPRVLGVERQAEQTAATNASQGPLTLAMQPVTLTFLAPAMEGEYLASVARSRWPVLVFIFGFDILCYLFRFCAKCINLYISRDSSQSILKASLGVSREMGPQLANMGLLYLFIGMLNRRSRTLGDTAARQEELLLSACMAMAICNLLASIGPETSQDYVYVAYFLICTSSFLKIRWWVGTSVLATPTVLANIWHRGRHLSILPADAVVHVVVAWAVGGLMAYLAEWYRRQVFASEKLATLAHQKEMLEAQARIKAQRQLAAAQAQAAQRALSVAREKAANEAKSEFMSLMCHEVRTPLNGCLASAEMLLETPLQEEQRELAKTIRVSGSILLSTVSNFLDFFKMEAGKALDIVRAEVDLSELVSDVHCIIEAMIGRNGDVRLLQPQMVGVPRNIVCDPDRVRGIMLNLYTNAAKFTKQGHIGLKVSEVGADYLPVPEPGYSLVTVTPAYQPRAADREGHGRTWRHSALAAPLTGSLAVDDDETTHSGSAWARQEAQSSAVTSDMQVEEAAQETNGFTNGPCQDDSRPSSVGGAAHEGSPAAEPGTPCSIQAAEAWQEAQAASRPLAPAAEAGGKPADSGEATSSTRWLLFEVMDTGIGIGQEGLKALFKEYVQGTEDEMKKPRSKGGTGLGLSICSKQVGVLGGRIGAHSCAGKGSVFWFTIPLCLPADTVQQVAPEPSVVFSPPASTVPEACIVHSEPGTAGQDASGMPFDSAACAPMLVALSSSSAVDARAVPLAAGMKGTKSPMSSTAGDQQESDMTCTLDVDMSAPGSRPQQQQLGSSALHTSASSSAAAQQQLLDTGAKPRDLSQPGSPVAPEAASAGLLPKPPSPSHETFLYAERPSESSTVTCTASTGYLRVSTSSQQEQLSAAAPLLGILPSLGSCNLDAVPNGTVTYIPVTGGTAILPPSSQSSPQDALPAGPAYTRCVSSSSSRRSVDMSSLKGLRALLVEDNLINQTVAKKMLTSLGIQCEVASNGLEALRVMERIVKQGGDAGAAAAAAPDSQPDARTEVQPFDVILMDMAMPVMGGVDATRAIRQLGANVPILAMTANASDKDRDECRSAGMDGFLSKPVLKDRLAEAIVQVIAGKAMSSRRVGAAAAAPDTQSSSPGA